MREIIELDSFSSFSLAGEDETLFTILFTFLFT